MFRIDLLLPPRTSPTALAVTVDVAEAANRIAPRPVLDVRLLGATDDVACRGGLSARAEAITRARPRDLVMLAGCGSATEAEIDEHLADPAMAATTDWLSAAGRSGSEVAASCTGVFGLGRAGLLDGRRCTTTWWLAPVLQARFPAAVTCPDAMVTRDGGVWTAGAAFAHIDLMLALVADKVGADTAHEVARRLVVDHRPSQARYLAPGFLASHDPLAARVEAYVRSRMSEPIRIEEIAAEVGASERTLGRRLRRATGLSPAGLVQKVRLDAALHLLRTTRLPISAVASRVGLESAATLHRLVVRHTRQPPGRFRASASAG